MNTNNNNQNTYSFIVEKGFIKRFQGKNFKLIRKTEDISKVGICLYPIPNVDFQVCKLTGPDVNIQVALGLIKKQIPQICLESVILTHSPVSGCEINEEISIKITSFSTPAHFYAQVASYKNYTELNSMNENLNTIYNQDAHVLNETELKVQNPCAIYNEGNWYRGIILAVGTDIVVRLLDYGNVVTTTRSNLKKLLPAFHKLSFQAVECKLENLQSSEVLLAGEWSEEARDFMNSITEKPNKIKLKSFDVDGTLIVELFACNRNYWNYSNWTSINATLINKRYANFIVHPLEMTGEYEYQIGNQSEAQSEGIPISIGSEFLSDVFKQTNSLPNT